MKNSIFTILLSVVFILGKNLFANDEDLVSLSSGKYTAFKASDKKGEYEKIGKSKVTIEKDDDKYWIRTRPGIYKLASGSKGSDSDGKYSFKHPRLLSIKKGSPYKKTYHAIVFDDELILGHFKRGELICGFGTEDHNYTFYDEFVVTHALTKNDQPRTQEEIMNYVKVAIADELSWFEERMKECEQSRKARKDFEKLKKSPLYASVQGWGSYSIIFGNMDHVKKAKKLSRLIPAFEKACEERNIGLFDFEEFDSKNKDKDFERERKILFNKVAVDLGIIEKPVLSEAGYDRYYKKYPYADMYKDQRVEKSFYKDLDGSNNDLKPEVKVYVDYVFQEEYWYKVELKYKQSGSSNWKSVKKYVSSSYIKVGGPYDSGRMVMSTQNGNVSIYLSEEAKKALGKKRTFTSNDNSEGITMEFTDKRHDPHTHRLQFIGADKVTYFDWDGTHDW